MGTYRKKPVVIEARQIDSLDYDGMCEIIGWCNGRAVDGSEAYEGDVIAIDTLEGTMYARPGDWIICGVKGEFYPCKPDIFEPAIDTAGWCAPCVNGDHSRHNGRLAGICVGCACSIIA